MLLRELLILIKAAKGRARETKVKAERGRSSSASCMPLVWGQPWVKGLLEGFPAQVIFPQQEEAPWKTRSSLLFSVPRLRASALPPSLLRVHCALCFRCPPPKLPAKLLPKHVPQEKLGLGDQPELCVPSTSSFSSTLSLSPTRPPSLLPFLLIFHPLLYLPHFSSPFLLLLLCPPPPPRTLTPRIVKLLALGSICLTEINTCAG